MIEHLNRLYMEKVEENKNLALCVNKLAEFILNEYYHATYVNKEQWELKKEEIVRKICLGE